MSSDVERKSRMSPDDGDPDAPATVVAAIVGAVLVFVAIVFLQALFNRAEDSELARKVTAAVPAELLSLRAEQLDRLNGYRWVDPSKGIVAIPIEQAMDVTVRAAFVQTPASR